MYFIKACIYVCVCVCVCVQTHLPVFKSRLATYQQWKSEGVHSAPHV